MVGLSGNRNHSFAIGLSQQIHTGLASGLGKTSLRCFEKIFFFSHRRQIRRKGLLPTLVLPQGSEAALWGWESSWTEKLSYHAKGVEGTGSV